MSRETRIFKLKNGDELVASTQVKMEGNKTVYSIDKPRKMIVQQTQQGPRSGLIPWVLSSPDCSGTLTEDDFYISEIADKEIADYYLEVTTSIALG